MITRNLHMRVIHWLWVTRKCAQRICLYCHTLQDNYLSSSVSCSSFIMFYLLDRVRYDIALMLQLCLLLLSGLYQSCLINTNYVKNFHIASPATQHFYQVVQLLKQIFISIFCNNSSIMCLHGGVIRIIHNVLFLLQRPNLVCLLWSKYFSIPFVGHSSDHPNSTSLVQCSAYRNVIISFPCTVCHKCLLLARNN